MNSRYFCRGPDDFCWGPAPVSPTLVTGSSSAMAERPRDACSSNLITEGVGLYCDVLVSCRLIGEWLYYHFAAGSFHAKKLADFIRLKLNFIQKRKTNKSF